MKYKKLLIILSCIAGAILLFVILLFTLFRLNKVELNFKNETTIFASEDMQNKVIKSGGFSYSLPIFSCDKKLITQKLELDNSYLKIINIETVFPNKLVVHCAQREELFTIKIGDNLYYTIDEDLKILTTSTSFESTQTNSVYLGEVEVKNKTAKVGEFLNLYNSEEILKNVATAFAYNNKTVSDIKGMFKQINVSYENNYFTGKSEVVLRFVTFDNFTIKIDLPSHHLIGKLNLMLTYIPHSVKYYNSHELVIKINPDNVLDTYIWYEELNNN